MGLGEATKEVEKDVNSFIRIFLDLAKKNYKCKLDKFGFEYVSGVPFQSLIIAVCACLQKRTIQMLKNELEMNGTLETEQLIRCIFNEIKAVLENNFIKSYEDKQLNEGNISIIACNEVFEKRQSINLCDVTFFYCCFKCNLDENDKKQLLKQYIYLPAIANVVSGLERRYSVPEKKDIESWKNGAEQDFKTICEKLVLEEEKIAWDAIDSVARRMKYIL